jgi:hypothetical protein
LFQLVPPDTHFDFLGKGRIAKLGESPAIILAGLAIDPRIRTGIDFAAARSSSSASRRAASRRGLDPERPASRARGRRQIRSARARPQYLLRMTGEIRCRGAAAAPAVETPRPRPPGAGGGAGRPAALARRAQAAARRPRRSAEAKLRPVDVERVELSAAVAQARRDGLLAWSS